MNNSDHSSLHATFDRPAAPAGQSSLRHLVIEFATPPLLVEESQPSKPLNLALVLDASGSMQGAPLRAAIEAACCIVRQLGSDDRLSVVSFASDVQTHLRAQRMDEVGKRVATDALQALATRGCTNLCGGWLAGAECVAALMEEDLAGRNHVLVLSDGMANEGICDPEELAHHAAALRDRRLLSSAVGIGEHYATTQLAAIAEHGGGRLHHAAVPEEIAAVVLGELEDVRRTMIHGLVVQIDVPEGIRAEIADSCPVRTEGRHLWAELGSVLSGSPRRLVVSLMLPHLTEGEELLFDVRASWREPDADEDRSLTVKPRLAISSNLSALQSCDIDAAVHAARAWLAAIERRLVEWNRRGLYQDARVYFDEQRQPFENHCRDLPGGAELIRSLQRAERLVRRSVPELRRKEIEIAAYKSMKGEIDKRRPDSDRPFGWG